MSSAAYKREKETQFSFSLLDSLIFPSIVRRFLAESYTDMTFVPEYDRLDVNVLYTLQYIFRFAKKLPIVP